MPRISLSEARPGMVLEEPIRRPEDGLILLQKNIELTESYIQKIQKISLESISVKEYQNLDEFMILEVIKEETRLKACSTLQSTFSQLQEDKVIEVNKLRDLVTDILDEILGDITIVYTLGKMNAYDNYVFSHSIDVCVFSLLAGSLMNLRRNEMEILGISALLHDIGKIFIDDRLLNKPDKLDTNEYEIVKTHTREGYDLLKKRANLSFLIPHMALQHHEREDGSGYPRGITGKRIHRFAKIIAVADGFDAMTSMRIYHQPVPAAAAIQEICENTPQKYSQDVVNCFKRIITPYVKGNILVLSNQQTVEVIASSRLKCLVRVIDGINQGEIYNLYQKPELSVVRRVC